MVNGNAAGVVTLLFHNLYIPSTHCDRKHTFIRRKLFWCPGGDHALAHGIWGPFIDGLRGF